MSMASGTAKSLRCDVNRLSICVLGLLTDASLAHQALDGISMKEWEEKRIKSLLMDAAYTGNNCLQIRIWYRNMMRQ